MTDDILTPDETAEVLKVSTKSVVKLCTGGLLSYFKVGKLYRIRREWIDDYIQQARHGDRVSDGVSDVADTRAIASTPYRKYPALRGGNTRGPHGGKRAS